MRTGVIISYNQKVRLGIIKDSNSQKIRFFNENEKVIYKRLDSVTFEIAFVDASLMAVEIVLVTSHKFDKTNVEYHLSRLVEVRAYRSYPYRLRYQ